MQKPQPEEIEQVIELMNKNVRNHLGPQEALLFYPYHRSVELIALGLDETYWANITLTTSVELVLQTILLEVLARYGKTRIT